MKKCLSWMVLFLLVLSVNAGVIEKTYYFNDYTVKNYGDYQAISFPNTLLTGPEGEPALPYCAVSLLLPPGQSAESIQFIGMEETPIEGFFRIYPQQAVRPISMGPSGNFLKNEKIYTMDGYYPSKATGMLTTQFMNGFAFGHSAFTPVRYNPLNGSVSFYKQVTIRITTKADNRSVNALKNMTSRPDILQSVKRVAQNPELMAQYPSRKSRTDDYQMLIITTASLQTAWQPLIDLYKIRGIKTLTVTKEYILANMTGQDAAEKVRNYIIQEYQGHNIEFVLLGGDVDLVPYRGLYCYVQSGSGYEDYDIPADLYFQSLDGNWNANGNNKWGEPGEDDLLPEISVARFTIGNLNELNRMLNKSIMYQSAPVLGEMTHPLFAGEHLYDSPNTEGSQYLELLIGHREDNGYTTDGITPDNTVDKMYDEITYWSGTDLINRLNQGRSFLYHAGHANSTYVMKLSNSDITNSNFSQVNGIIHNFTFVSTHGCDCGAFDEEDCIAEKMVNISNFAAGFIGNSRYGWFNEGQTEGPSAHLQREFVDALYHDGYLRIGRAMAESKTMTAPWVTAPGQWEPGALRWNFYDCNLLSDPALSLWTKEPMTVQAAYQAALPLGVPTLPVTVTSGGLPVSMVNCVIMMNGEVHGVASTDASGAAVVTIDPPFATVGEAQLIISGNNCLPQTFPLTVIPNSGAFVICRAQAINDTLGNSNGAMDYGETILLSLTMKNVGSVPAENVAVTLSTEDPYITLNDASQNYGTIAANDSVTIPFGFKFTVADNVPDNHLTPFQVAATNGTDTWNTDFQIIAHAPVLQAGTMTIADASGNNNGRLDPGETADLIIQTSNIGSSVAVNTQALLNTTNSFVTINTASVDLGNLAPGTPVTATFNVTVDPSAPIGSVANFIYTATSGEYAVEKTYVAKIGLVLEDFESGGFTQFAWTQGGNQPWTITNTEPFEGIWSAKSGAITHSQKSTLSLQMDVASEDSISFYLKTSSESNYDFLKFFLDGTSLGQWSGENGWGRVAYAVPAGNHTFKWEYSKDGSVSNGSDAAWIDYIIFPAAASSGASVNGTVTYANTVNTPLQGLTVKLKNNNGVTIGTTTTNASGSYTFNAVPAGSYTFEVTTTKPWNSVSAADVLMYRKHIANITLLDGIWLASGDVNASETVTAADVLLIKKRIATVISNFPTGDWLFNHTPFTLSNTNLTRNFNGIVYGDANGSYVPTSQKAAPASQGSLSLQALRNDATSVTVPLLISDMPDLGSFQFTLLYDASKLEFDKADNWYPGIDEPFVASPSNGMITFVWAAGNQGIAISDAALCELHFTLLGNEIPEISLTSSPTAIEFTDFEGIEYAPKLLKYSGNSVPASENNLFVYPNPSKGLFQITTGNPFNGKTTLRVINAAGVTVMENSNVLTGSGYTTTLDLTAFPDGIYLLTVEDNAGVYHKKIILQK